MDEMVAVEMPLHAWLLPLSPSLLLSSNNYDAGALLTLLWRLTHAILFSLRIVQFSSETPQTPKTDNGAKL